MKNNVKEDLINELVRMLQSRGEIVRIDADTSIGDKVTQMDILIDTMKFLDNYDENIRVLNDYWINKDTRFPDRD